MNITNKRVMLLSVGARRGQPPPAALFVVSPSFNIIIPDPYAKPLKGSYDIRETLLLIQKNLKICFGKKNFKSKFQLPRKCSSVDHLMFCAR